MLVVTIKLTKMVILGFHCILHQYGCDIGYSGVHVCSYRLHVLSGQPLRVDTVSQLF